MRQSLFLITVRPLAASVDWREGQLPSSRQSGSTVGGFQMFGFWFCFTGRLAGLEVA